MIFSQQNLLIPRMNSIIKNNIQKMFKARKYKNITINDNLITAEDGDKKVMAKLIEGRLNISSVKSCIGTFAENNIDVAMIIHEGEPTSSAKKTVAHLDGTGKIRVALFSQDYFLFNLMDHRLVRPHVRLKREESLQMKKTYGADKLPVILTSDPVSRYFNFRPGEIISITRKGGFVSYRIVK